VTSDAPIFQQFHDLAPGFPYLPLADLPTPVVHHPGIRENLWVKHDDVSSSLYGGNKVRKLEFILPQAQKAGKSHIITFGGTGTNHGLATALFCRELGMRCTVLLFEQPDSDISIINYHALKKTGARLIHCGSVFRTALSFYLSQRLLHPNAYFLFAGGSNVEGCVAFVNAALELKQQYDNAQLTYPDVIFCATGSTGTCAGLTLGCHLAGLPTRVIGVRVADSHLGPIATCTTGTITSLMKKTLAKLRRYQRDIAPGLPQAHLLDDYFGTAYGAATEAGNTATTIFANQRIKLEPTYTAKAAAAALDYCDRHSEETVLYWHTFNSVEIT
jgi:D-cysteine desulfhydrase